MKNLEIKFDIEDLINKRGLNGVVVGNHVESIKAIFGEADFTPGRLNKKSRVYIHIYGNVTFFSEGENIIGINVDFHGNRLNIISADDLQKMTLNEWLEFSRNYHCSVNKINEITAINGEGFSIKISPSGNIGMLSFT